MPLGHNAMQPISAIENLAEQLKNMGKPQTVMLCNLMYLIYKTCAFFIKRDGQKRRKEFERRRDRFSHVRSKAFLKR